MESIDSNNCKINQRNMIAMLTIVTVVIIITDNRYTFITHIKSFNIQF